MDREKVVKGLESLRDICNAKSNMAIGEGKIAWAGYANTSDDAIALLKEQERKDKMFHALEDDWKRLKELLKEQEAKHVIRKQCKKEHDDGSIDYFAEWYCPHCNMLILRGFDNPSIKFCYKCGKPILWEGR